MNTTKPTFICGHIADYFVIVYQCKAIGIYKGEKLVAEEKPEGLERFIENAKDLRLGWAQLEGGDEVIYLYDKQDNNFGYAVNLDSPQCSEWGYNGF